MDTGVHHEDEPKDSSPEENESTINMNTLINAGLSAADIDMFIKAGYKLSSEKNKQHNPKKPWPEYTPLV
ncbi:hypothetical protein R1flu_002324 [Riccia fluitans]|uniref:Uncharacterized protein n=1 Tax=Riccia fluitans TaxID=41844 RepID=A0ABD1Y6S9_9MARC